ncbi:MAG: hypothetical protein JNN08_06080 [Bryobacterales bacterium]|nr:hypothetical protein [Bryobacterales bacterium]
MFSSSLTAMTSFSIVHSNGINSGTMLGDLGHLRSVARQQASWLPLDLEQLEVSRKVR